ncbi:MAG: hypothetical protein AB1758_38000, partial [Candidatus Eremiobacterota bacterium]
MPATRWLAVALLIGLLSAGLTVAQLWLGSPGGALGLRLVPYQARLYQAGTRMSEKAMGLAAGDGGGENRRLRQRILELEAEQ